MEAKRIVSVILILVVIASVVIGGAAVAWSGLLNTSGGGGGGGGGPPVGNNTVVRYLQAKNIAFNVSTITVPAGANITIVFTNLDSGVQHNFALFTNASATPPALFTGQRITGVSSINYSFVAPSVPGNYFFHCDVHPTLMTGTFVVTGAIMTANVYLEAHNIAFNVSTITVPAGANVVVHFSNMDSGVPHNFAVYQTSAAQNAIFQGQRITGVSSTTYSFTAPTTPGNYFFRCDVHPTLMTGTFVVIGSS
jgi:plastocyanin